MADRSRPAIGYPVSPSCDHQPEPNGLHPPPPPQLVVTMRCVLFALLFVFALFVAMAALVLLVDLGLSPKEQVVHPTSLSVTDFNLSSSNQQLSGTWAARFEVYNPDKKITLEYGHIRARLLYEKELMAQNGIPPFSQDSRDTTVLDVCFNIVNAFFDGSVVKNIDRERADGFVGFNLRVLADVVFNGDRFRSNFQEIMVVKFLCQNVVVGGLGSNSSSGNLTGGPRKCNVEWN